MRFFKLYFFGHIGVPDAQLLRNRLASHLCVRQEGLFGMWWQGIVAAPVLDRNVV
jgi:hypothetical protein